MLNSNDVILALPTLMKNKMISRKKVVSIVIKNPSLSYQYARDVLKKPWPEGEMTIMKSPQWAYCYAKGVLKRPWPEAEAVIIRDPEFAFFYSKYVLHKPWPEAEAEASISKHPCLSKEYLAFLKSKNLQPTHPELLEGG